MILTLGARQEGTVPLEVADEVTKWFREHGRSARLVWNSGPRCGEIRVRFKDGDPRLKGYQQGQYATDYESFWLHYEEPGRGLVAYNLEELGAGGVRALLDKANLWSGTGRYRSLQESISAVEEENQRAKAAMVAAAEQVAWDNAHEKRARILNLPRSTAQRPARLAHAKE